MATVFGVINFGIQALVLILICIATCVASEWIFEKLIHKKSTINDFSAVVTGLLLALNLPHTLQKHFHSIHALTALQKSQRGSTCHTVVSKACHCSRK